MDSMHRAKSLKLGLAGNTTIAAFLILSLTRVLSASSPTETSPSSRPSQVKPETRALSERDRAGGAGSPESGTTEAAKAKKSAEDASWSAFISACASVAAVVVTLIIAVVSYRNQQRDRQVEILRRQVNEFYGPMLQLLGISKRLHEKLKSGKAPNWPINGSRTKWRTLIGLLQEETFKPFDKSLLDEINRTTSEIEDYIRTKASLVQQDSNISDLLAQAAAHFVIIRLATQGALRTVAGPDRDAALKLFDDMVYPDELNGVLQRHKDALLQRIVSLENEAHGI